MDTFTRGVILIAACIGIVAGGLYISNNSKFWCNDYIFFKSCGVITR